MKRREIVKGLTLLPFAGGMAVTPLRGIFASPAHGGAPFVKNSINAAGANDALKTEPQIYQSIGVEPFVNCKGTHTIMGGSTTRPVVRAAMEAASPHIVQLDELAFGVGQRLAEITGAEWGMISAGCAAGIKLVTIGCLSDGDPEKLLRIPDLTGFEKSEVIIPRSARNAYDHAIRNAGVKIIMVDTQEELVNAINSRTAMIYTQAETKSPLSIEDIAKITKPKNIPILVDAAAHILTIPNVHLAKGASVVAYSGGKAFKGPGCAGLLLGNKDILMSAWQASSPHNGPGRDNKVGREEHIGMLAAVEEWIKMDHKAEMKTWVSWLNNIANRVSGIESVKTAVREPDPELIDHVTPTLTISWDPAKLNITGQELAEELGHTSPRIAVSGGGAAAGTTSISLVGYIMSPGDDKIAGDRIYEVLSRKRSPKPMVAMKTPAANISGRWDVTVEFFRGKNAHIFFIDKQDGNWLQGTHKGTFAVRDLTGTIEGDQVKFQSNYSVPGDRISYIFFGTVTGDTMSGNVDMGEYITAKFTAKRSVNPARRTPIVIPNGRPQAS
jgi:D-glucosaminate-6-phosphate ammonia-lyase